MAVARNGELDRVSGGGFRVPISHGDSATGGAGDDPVETADNRKRSKVFRIVDIPMCFVNSERLLWQ